MNGPAYPIIKRLRIPRGPHRLRDRRWPPVEPPMPDSQPVASQPEPMNEDTNAMPQDIGSIATTTNRSEIKTKSSTGSAPIVIAGSEETITPPADPSFWEETKPSASEMGNQTDGQPGNGKKESEASETSTTGGKHTQSTF